MRKAIRIVNALIKKYGYPDEIVIEMPRDKNSDEEKKRITDEQKKNEAEINNILSKIQSDYGIEVTNDPKTFETLMVIYREYSTSENKVNPFIEYERETGDVVRKYSKKHNGPRITKIKYTDGEVNNCIDISEKYGHEKGNKKVILESLNPYRTDVYYNTNSRKYYLIGLRYSDLCFSRGRYSINKELYDNLLRSEKMIKPEETFDDLKNLGFEFMFSLYNINNKAVYGNPLLNGGEYMSTFEATVDLMKNLPENDLLKINAFINRMINNRNDNKETYNPFVSLSREEIFVQLEYSRKRADEGQVIPAHQAANAVLEDYDATIDKLAAVAGRLKILEDPEFAEKGYRKIRFQRHNYYLIYRIVEDKAVVYRMFHDLQDLDNALR